MKKIIVCFLLLAVCLSLIACGSADREIDAWVCAQDVVEKNLKSPSTAKFCSYTEAQIIELGNDEYQIRGYVDAQNGFGAIVRENFTVTLTLTDKGYTNGTCTFS